MLIKKKSSNNTGKGGCVLKRWEGKKERSGDRARKGQNTFSHDGFLSLRREDFFADQDMK